MLVTRRCHVSHREVTCNMQVGAQASHKDVRCKPHKNLIHIAWGSHVGHMMVHGHMVVTWWSHGRPHLVKVLQC